MNKKYPKNAQDIRVSDKEREILLEIVRSEKANLQVFSLPNKRENKEYKELLSSLDSKLA